MEGFANGRTGGFQAAVPPVIIRLAWVRWNSPEANNSPSLFSRSGHALGSFSRSAGFLGPVCCPRHSCQFVPFVRECSLPNRANELTQMGTNAQSCRLTNPVDCVSRPPFRRCAAKLPLADRPLPIATAEAQAWSPPCPIPRTQTGQKSLDDRRARFMFR